MGSNQDSLFPWRKGKREGSFKRPRSIPTKAGMPRRIGSVSKSEAQRYLDIYCKLKKEEILEKIGDCIGNEQEQIAEKWVKLEREIEEVKTKLIEGWPTKKESDSRQAKKGIPAKPMRTMFIDY